MDSRWRGLGGVPEEDFGRPAADLSPRGAERREEILVELERALSRRHRRRSALRWAAVGACGLVLTLASLRRDPGEPLAAGVPRDGAAIVRIEYVRDDPAIIHRLRLVPPPEKTFSLVANDSELLALLDEAQLPSGLIRIGDQLILTAFEPLRPSQ